MQTITADILPVASLEAVLTALPQANESTGEMCAPITLPSAAYASAWKLDGGDDEDDDDDDTDDGDAGDDADLGDDSDLLDNDDDDDSDDDA
jgi:hypothetical protein